MQMKISLGNLVNRIEFDTKRLQEYPEHKEMLEKRIARSKELIVECALQNKHNPMLERILMR